MQTTTIRTLLVDAELTRDRIMQLIDEETFSGIEINFLQRLSEIIGTLNYLLTTDLDDEAGRYVNDYARVVLERIGAKYGPTAEMVPVTDPFTTLISTGIKAAVTKVQEKAAESAQIRSEHDWGV